MTRIACTQTLFYSASADPEKENIDLFIFHFVVFEIGFYQARSTDFEEKIEALWTGYDKKNFFLAERYPTVTFFISSFIYIWLRATYFYSSVNK